MISTDEIVAQARSLVGVPWRHQGRTQRGVDCIGLIVLAFKGAGIDWAKVVGTADKHNYGRGAQPELLNLIRMFGDPIQQPIEGCLILMKFAADHYPRHVGIYSKGNIIHADARAGRVVEHGYRGVWKRCQHSLWKMPGVIYA